MSACVEKRGNRNTLEAKSTEDLINACMALMDCLREAHQEEIEDDHGGEKGCLYCKALEDGKAAVKQGLAWNCGYVA